MNFSLVMSSWTSILKTLEINGCARFSEGICSAILARISEIVTNSPTFMLNSRGSSLSVYGMYFSVKWKSLFVGIGTEIIL